jgi:hypothetical protein
MGYYQLKNAKLLSRQARSHLSLLKTWPQRDVESYRSCWNHNLLIYLQKRGYEAAEKFCWQYNDRYNDRLMSDDPQFSSFILERVKTYIPDLLHGHWRLKASFSVLIRKFFFFFPS